MLEVIFAAIVGLGPESDVQHIEHRQPAKTEAVSVRTKVDAEAHRARTFEEVGKENGFTWEQWQAFYARMDGFSTVNGIRIAPSLSAQ